MFLKLNFSVEQIINEESSLLEESIQRMAIVSWT